MSMTGWLLQMWTDPRLAWDKEEWDGMDRLRIPANQVGIEIVYVPSWVSHPLDQRLLVRAQVWLPDIALYNSVGKMEANYMSWEDTSKVVVMSTGMVKGETINTERLLLCHKRDDPFLGDLRPLPHVQGAMRVLIR